LFICDSFRCLAVPSPCMNKHRLKQIVFSSSGGSGATCWRRSTFGPSRLIDASSRWLAQPATINNYLHARWRRRRVATDWPRPGFSDCSSSDALLYRNFRYIATFLAVSADLKKVKVPYPIKMLMECSSSLLWPWACRWINHWSLWRMASATADLRLPSQSRTSLPCYWYQIILLGDRNENIKCL